mmetsp:Transcript_29320/g.49250  ORF Transcript_29320/g.49250 Transcript_29320/m.49250 type:complete len:638 (+) Transcript_29320:128-2041(+)
MSEQYAVYLAEGSQAWANVSRLAMTDLKKGLKENDALREVILEQLSEPELELLIAGPSGEHHLLVSEIRELTSEEQPDAFDLEPTLPNLVQRLTLIKEMKQTVTRQNGKMRDILLEFLSAAELKRLLPPPWGTKEPLVSDGEGSAMSRVLARELASLAKAEQIEDAKENNALVVHAGNAQSKANVSGKEALLNIEVLDLRRQNTVLAEQVQKKEDLIVKLKAYTKIMEERQEKQKEEIENVVSELEKKKKNQAEMNEMIANLQENIDELLTEKDEEIHALQNKVLELANQLTFFVDPDAEEQFRDVKDLTLEIMNGPKNEEHDQEILTLTEALEELQVTVEVQQEQLQEERRVRMKWEKTVKEYADQVQLVSGCLLETSEKAIKKDVLIAEQERVIAERELMIQHMDQELKSSNSKLTQLMFDPTEDAEFDQLAVEQLKAKEMLETRLTEARMDIAARDDRIRELVCMNSDLQKMFLDTTEAEKPQDEMTALLLEAAVQEKKAAEKKQTEEAAARRKVEQEEKLLKEEVALRYAENEAEERKRRELQWERDWRERKALETTLEKRAENVGTELMERVRQQKLDLKEEERNRERREKEVKQAAKARSQANISKDERKGNMLSMMSERLKRLEDLASDN